MLEFVSSFWNLVPVTMAQSLLYGFVALGIMIPFRLLSFPDLTCEGAFPLGACVCAALLVVGMPPVLATILAILGGFLAGCATAFIHLKFRINTLLAGILMITMLWSVNLRVMGKSNTPLFSEPNLFDSLIAGFTQSVTMQIVSWAITALLSAVLLVSFLRTEVGLAVRALGVNDVVVRSAGVNVWRYTIVGVGAANAFNAFAGAAAAQVQGYADVGMGFGILINGLAALIIGEALIGRSSVVRQVAAPFVGSVVYYQAISVGLAAGVHPSDLKLVTGLFVLAALALPFASKRRVLAEPKLKA